MVGKRAHIHHRDGDPLNNELENIMVLCSSCHAKEHRKGKRHHVDGVYISVSFSPKKRQEILSLANYQCGICGCKVEASAPVRRVQERVCSWCGYVVPKSEIIEWQDGRRMCVRCFNKWAEEL